MIRTLLLLLMSCIVAYGQDTLAVVTAPYRAKDANVFFQGDSVFIQVIHETVNANIHDASYGWYRSGEKVRDVRLDFLHSSILGVKQYGDTTYYYGFDDKGKNSEIHIGRSVDDAAAEFAIGYAIEGNVIGAVEKDGALLLVTFSRRKKTFHVHQVKGVAYSKVSQLTIPWNIDHITNDDIVMVSPTRSSVISAALKVFLQGDILGIVLDDPMRNLDDPASYRKTAVIRKNLATGKQETDGFRVKEPAPYVSYLDGNLLYRLAGLNKDWNIYVQDLDSNKLRYQLPLSSLNETVAYQKSTRRHQITKIDRETLIKDRATSIRVFLGLNDIEDQKILTVTFGNDSGKEAAVFLPIPGGPGNMLFFLPGLASVVSTSSEYLVGTPDTGFKVAAPNTKFGRMLAEEYEIKNQEVQFDHVLYLPGENYLIGAYGLAKSPVIVFVRFPARP